MVLAVGSCCDLDEARHATDIVFVNVVHDTEEALELINFASGEDIVSVITLTSDANSLSH